MTDTLAQMRFNEGRSSLAPASRTALADAILAVPEAQRQPIVDAIQSVQFVELGERGFQPTERTGDVTLTASERKHVADLAKSMGVSAEEAERKFLEVKRERQQALGTA